MTILRTSTNPANPEAPLPRCFADPELRAATRRLLAADRELRKALATAEAIAAEFDADEPAEGGAA